MSVAWPQAVNTKAFGMQTTFKDNLTKIEFECGKTRSWLKNSSAKKTFTFSLRMRDNGTSGEFQTFLRWYKEILLAGSETFTFPDLITHTGLTEYRMTAIPTATGQMYKTVSISVEED